MRVVTKVAVIPRRGASEAEPEPEQLVDGWAECDARALRVSSGLTVALAMLECGWLVPAAEGVACAAVLRTPRELVWVSFDAKRPACEWLEAAGVDPARKALEINLGLSGATVGGVSAGMFGGGAAALVALHGVSAMAVASLVMGAVAALGAVTALHQRVRVGVDGVDRRRGFLRDFVRIEDIEGVKNDEFSFVIHRQGGAPMVLWEWDPTVDKTDLEDSLGHRDRTRLSRILAERIASLRSLHERFSPAHPRFAVLDRNGRDDATWRAELAALLSPSGAYRAAAPLAPDDLERLISHPDTPAERRVGAVLALRALSEDRARQQVEALAASVADRALVDALRRALSG